jgi:predicted transporter
MQRKIFDQKTTAVKIGFEWWGIYGWLGLTLGNIFLFIQLDNHIGIAIFSIIINSIMMNMILKFNKYAFLIATILSLNPIIWIINGIYLKKSLATSKNQHSRHCKIIKKNR